MSYLSYAESEFKLVPEYSDTKEHVLKILAVISDQGHSGGSMGFYRGLFGKWIENPEVDNTDPMIKPVWDLVSHLEPELRSRVLEVVSRLMVFEPLSHLTGADDEWNLVSSSNGIPMYQNRRKSSVFKEGGQAYWIDARVYGEPTEGYADFTLFTDGLGSKADIEFPFDPKTPSQYVYYTDSERTEVISGDHEQWLVRAYRNKSLGYSHSGVFIPEAHVIDESEFDLVKSIVLAIKNYCIDLKDLSDTERRGLGYWSNSRDEYTLNVYTKFETSRAMPEYLELKERVVVCTDVAPLYILGIKGTVQDIHVSNDGLLSIAGLSERVVLNVIRLLFEASSSGVWDIDRYSVRSIGKNYQNWEDYGLVNPVVTATDSPVAPGELKYLWDDGFLDLESEQPYKALYERCKDLGLEYKGRRN